ncbi:hypothetical protein COW46_00385 [Candidatus Gracilibacteria bacterium CG17_big_fil_post_rev_8_21_14_2_50_48_13]|nr:MAG: hypothetical protein COW46_00385 [Candidatus Gracilibacteria bacterium CG17_big_fil_post_rev_8_21_14_2_50_48_13]
MLTISLGLGIANAQLGSDQQTFPYGVSTSQTNPGSGLDVGLQTLQNKVDEGKSGIIQEDNLRTLVVNWTSYFLQYYMVVAVGLLIYFGVRLILAGGSEDERKKLVQALINLAIGTLIIFLSYAIVNQIVNLISPAGNVTTPVTTTTNTPTTTPPTQ